MNADGTGLDGPDMMISVVLSIGFVVGAGTILYAAWRWSQRHAEEQRRLHDDEHVSEGRLNRLREEGF